MAKRRSLIPALVGVAVIVAASIGHVWNEWRTDRRESALHEAKASYVEGSLASPGESRDGRLVYLSGDLTVASPALDSLFGISADAVRLDRVVEMYQWREVRKDNDDQDHRYNKVWFDGRIPSERFRKRAGHENPKAPGFSSESFFADARLGVMHVDPALIEALPASPAVAIIGLAGKQIGGASLEIHGGGLISGDPANPEIGDIRIAFVATPAGPVSILALQDAGRLAPWMAANGHVLTFIEPRVASADELLSAHTQESWLHSWGYRALFTLATMVGSIFTIPPLAQRIAWLGRIRSQGPLVAHLVLPGALSLLTIGLSWLVVKPAIALAGLAAAAAILAVLEKMNRGRQSV